MPRQPRSERWYSLTQHRVGWNWMATQAEADGYTLGAYNIPHFIAQSIEGGVEYSAESFEPIANWGADPAVFVVAADSEFNFVFVVDSLVDFRITVKNLGPEIASFIFVSESFDNSLEFVDTTCPETPGSE